VVARLILAAAVLIALQPTDAQSHAQRDGRGLPAFQPYPTNLPSAFVETANFAFDRALDDPRQAEYRAVRVLVRSSLVAESEAFDVHGWTYEDPRSKRTMAVCWDGMTYEVVRDLGWAHFPSDVVSELERSRNQSWPRRDGARPGFPSFTLRSIVGAALAYRVGEDTSASLILAELAGEGPVWYWTTLSSQAAIGRFHRGVANFLAARDEEALQDLTRACRLRDDAEERVMSFPEELRRSIYNFDFPQNLEAMRDAAADRIAHPLKIERDWTKVGPRDRLAQLLMRCAESADVTWYRDTRGSQAPDDEIDTYLAEHPFPPIESSARPRYLCSAYRAAYLEAVYDVPHLIEVAKSEDFAARCVLPAFTLSQSIGYTPPERKVSTARMYADQLVSEIIAPAYAEDLAPDGDQYDRALAYWNRYRHVPVNERTVVVLGDEGRSPEAWIQAIETLGHIGYFGRGQLPTLRYQDFLTDDIVARVFLSLEAHVDGTSSRLRTEELVRKALATYNIAPGQALPYLQRAAADLYARHQDPDSETTSKHMSAEQQLTILRLQLGDDRAAAEHLAYIEHFYQPLRLNLRDFHLPMLVFPDEPHFKALAMKMFLEFRDRVLSYRQNVGGDEIAACLAFDELRPMVADLLKSDLPYGRATMHASPTGDKVGKDGLYRMSVRVYPIKGTGYSGLTAEVTKEELSYIGQERALQLRDLVADRLYRAGVGPEIQLYWPDERRRRLTEEYASLVSTAPFRLDQTLEFRGGVPWWCSRTPVRLRADREAAHRSRPPIN
jgi:hypothetical protein